MIVVVIIIKHKGNLFWVELHSKEWIVRRFHGSSERSSFFVCRVLDTSEAELAVKSFISFERFRRNTVGMALIKSANLFVSVSSATKITELFSVFRINNKFQWQTNFMSFDLLKNIMTFI